MNDGPLVFEFGDIKYEDTQTPNISLNESLMSHTSDKNTSCDSSNGMSHGNDNDWSNNNFETSSGNHVTATVEKSRLVIDEVDYDSFNMTHSTVIDSEVIH